ncbi:MAG: helix-turn-helix domain-containing protein [Bacteroidales bacterium]
MEALIIPGDKFDELLNKIDSLTEKVDCINNVNPLKDKWLDIQEVCILLKISKRTLQSYRDNGVLPYSQIGSKIYYRASDIEEHLKSHYKPAYKNK